MVVVGYGQIIPQSIIDIAPLGIINVHASLLPELRGAAPIQWSIARGYERTGVTTMRIDAGLDTGDMLLQWETPIGPDETAPELSARLAEAGADLLVETLAGLCAGTVAAAAAGQCTRHLRAHPEKGRRAHRLEQSSPTDSRFDSWISTLARSAHFVPRPVASPLALAPGSATDCRICAPGALVSTQRRRLRRSAATAPLSNYWKYNSKAVKECRRKFSPTAIDLTHDRPTWSMRPFDLPLGFKYATTTLAFANRKRTTLP